MDDINNAQPKGTFMLRIIGPLRTVPMNEHSLLRNVADDITPNKVLEVVRLIARNLVRWGIAEPRISIAGINPHASFDEDVQKIAPAIERAIAEGINGKGPIARDSVFRQTIEGRYDAIVAM